jgi:prepilin signal peptidase PulO-like enzyme (type II secretory pathway)
MNFILKSKNFLKKHKNNFLLFFYFLIICLFFVKSINSIAALLLINENIVLKLISFIFLFLFITLLLKIKKKVDISSLITLFSILIAILFFMFENYQDTFLKIQSLQIVTNMNCEYSKIIYSDKIDQTENQQKQFFYDIYNQNIAFIMNQFGPPSVGATYRAIASMEKANNMYNDKQKYVEAAKEVKKYVCDEMGPYFYSKTDLLVNSSFLSVSYKIFKDYLSIRY